MTSSSACNPVRVINTLDPTVLEERAQLIVKAAAYLTPERWPRYTTVPIATLLQSR